MTTTESTLRLSARARSLRPSATLAVTARVAALRAEGRDVIGFGAGEPDFDTPEPIRGAAIEALRAGRTHYEPVPGAPEAREAIAAKLVEENGIPCRATDVIISTGAKQSLYLALQCLVDPDGANEVVILTPAWVSYRPMTELAGGRVVEVPGAVENDFKVEPAHLDAAIGPRTAAVIVNSPSNPCGIVYEPDELAGLAEVLARHPHVAVLSDEIYEKLVFGGSRHQSLGAFDAIADRTVTINGLSKSYAMTGWRIGYAAALDGGGGLIRAMSSLQSQMTSCITSFCYPAIVEALRGSDDEVLAMRDAFAARAQVIHGLVAAWPGVRCPEPRGAFYVFPDVSAWFGRRSPGGRPVEGAVQFAGALLEEADVAVVPGDDFGDAARAHVRLSFACSEDRIREGCGRIADWLHRFD